MIALQIFFFFEDGTTPREQRIKMTGLRTTTAGDVAAPPYTNGPYTWDQQITLDKMQHGATAVTATAAGAAIPAGCGFINVTSASCNFIVTLPSPVVGHVVRIVEPGNTGYELRTSAPATIYLNGGGGTANAETAIGATAGVVVCTCISATAWVAYKQTDDGGVEKIAAAAT